MAAQPAITCSKLIMTNGVVLVSLLLTLRSIFHTLFDSVFIVNFEQVNANWQL